MTESPAACACGARPATAHAVGGGPELKHRYQPAAPDRGAGTRAAEDGGGGALLRRRADPDPSVQEALRGVGRQMLANHLRHCATEAIRSGDAAQAETVYQEIVELAFRAR